MRSPCRSLAPRLPALLVALSFALSPALSAAERPALLLGLLLPPEEAASNSLRQGIQLAIDLANEAGGLPARLVIRGRPGQWGDDGTEAARMVLDDGVRGLITPGGGAPSHLAMQVSGRTATPLVSLCADTSVTGPMIPWVVRIVPSNIDEGRIIFAGVKSAESEKKLRWGAFLPDGRPGREASNDLLRAATNEGSKLEKSLQVSSKATNFAALAAEMLRVRPEAILLWLDAEPAAQLTRSLRTSGYAGILAGPGRLRSAAFLAGAGDAAEAFICPEIVSDPQCQQVYQRFATIYRGRFQADPDPTATFAYDAARLLIDILRKSGSESPHRAFPLEEPMPGASGTLKFDRNGNRIVQLELRICRGGRFISYDRSK